MFWKAPRLESILVPQLGVALRFTVGKTRLLRIYLTLLGMATKSASVRLL